MKVVFLEDVPNMAEVGDIKEVADGYGRNYLIPRKLAVIADSQATNIIEVQRKKKVRLQAQIEAEMKELAQQLEGQEVVLKAKAGATDRLYGSITTADIAEELGKSTGLEVDKRKIEIAEPIREVGSYEVVIRLTGDIIPKIRLTVMGEEKAEAKAKKETKKKTREKKETKEKKETRKKKETKAETVEKKKTKEKEEAAEETS